MINPGLETDLHKSMQKLSKEFSNSENTHYFGTSLGLHEIGFKSGLRGQLGNQLNLNVKAFSSKIKLKF